MFAHAKQFHVAFFNGGCPIHPALVLTIWLIRSWIEYSTTRPSRVSSKYWRFNANLSPFMSISHAGSPFVLFSPNIVLLGYAGWVKNVVDLIWFLCFLVNSTYLKQICVRFSKHSATELCRVGCIGKYCRLDIIWFDLKYQKFIWHNVTCIYDSI